MYTAPEVASAFASLYKNEDGLMDKLFAYWSVVSEKFSSNPNVIGYDIFNEPWPANMYHDASLFDHPDKFDREILFPMAQKANKVVREKDTEKAIFFEGAQFPDTQPFFGGKTYPLGFPETPGGASEVDRQVLNDHTYCCQAAGSMCESGEPPIKKEKECRKFHAQKVEQRAVDAENYHVPLMFTEFGACFDGQECANEINSSTDAFDDHLASWSYWVYKSFSDFTTTGGTREGMFNSDGTPQALKLQAIARTYAYAFQGRPTDMHFDRETGAFHTRFILDIDVKEPTEIYVNKQIWYPNGFTTKATDDLGKEYDDFNFVTKDGENYLSVELNASPAMNAELDGANINITITPNAPANFT